jgi:class 3 adenylate cyclase/tetratricopeptide (TPR) repeat protein
MVAVLFTDLVGSTDLMTRLGEAVFDELRRAHFAALAQSIERTGGEEIKNTGDGVMATFGSVVDAIGCAVAMQQATERQARTAEAFLAIRVGLSVGEVTFEGDDVFGATVVEAARLVAAAGSGQIVTTVIAKSLAGGRAEVDFVDLGPLDLKGLPQPVAVCEVLWEPLPEPTVPMPRLLTDVGRIFVGRDAKVERLSQLWKESAVGERRVALLAGEPGVGKTRLAAELARAVHSEGAIVLAGRCDEDLGVPYQPFVEALRGYLAYAGELELGRHGGELTRLVPELAQRAPGLPPPLQSDPETERYRLFDAVAAWLGNASAETPVLLVLDDLHWAARPTLLLLRHVLRSPEPMRLLVLATYRDTELGRTHPLSELLADLRRIGGVERVSLSGLDQPGVVAFMEQAAGHDLDEEDLALARAVHEETEGNPFFVGEVLRHLAETGAIERRGERWVTAAVIEELGIPEGVRDVVGRRCSRLSEAANRALHLASVVGPEFELAVLQAAGGLDEDSLVAALDEAVAARLVAEVPGPVPRNRFAHTLVRATLYDELSAARRVTLHRRVAEAIEDIHAARLDDHLPALAHHWARAATPAVQTAKAVEYAHRAGDRALAQLAHDEAVTYYRQALELLEVTEGSVDESQRCELLIALGEAQRRAGDPTYRETLLDAARLARELGDVEALARAGVANYRGLLSSVGRVDSDRVAVLEQALQALGPGDSPIRTRLMANLAAEVVYAGDPRHQALSEEAVAMARRLDEPETLAHVLQSRIVTIWGPDRPRERLIAAKELLAVAERLGDPVLSFHGNYQRFLAAMDLGDVEEADHGLDAAEQLAAELGQPMLRWVTMCIRANRELIAGRIQRSEDLAAEALELGRTAGQPDAELFFGVHLFNTRFEQGRLGEVAEAFARVASENPGVVSVRARLATLYCEIGREDDARVIFEPLPAELPQLPREITWLSGVAQAAYACVHLGDRERAARLLDLLAPYADLTILTGVSWFGSVAHHLGALAAVLGRFDDAGSRFAAAEATHERIGSPTWLARTRLEWARMLLTRRRPGDAERANELLGHALGTARELGLTNVERRAVALLQ